MPLFLFDLVHSDVWQSPVLSVSGFKYYVLFTDDYARYTWIYPVRRKSEVLTLFRTFLAFIKITLVVLYNLFKVTRAKSVRILLSLICATPLGFSVGFPVLTHQN